VKGEVVLAVKLDALALEEIFEVFCWDGFFLHCASCCECLTVNFLTARLSTGDTYII